MEILKTTDIYFEGNGHITGNPYPIYMRDDEGNRFWVHIPNNSDIIHAFQWMGESNILGDLVNLEPKYEDNLKAVEAAYNNNEQTFQVAAATGAIRIDKRINSMTYAVDEITSWSGQTAIPKSSWRVTWTFWKPESAVMMKLALQGAKCDTMK